METSLPQNSNNPLNLYQRITRSLVAHARTSFLIPIVWRFYGRHTPQVQLSYLSSLPAGTLGRGVAEILQRHNLQLIPHYENHDLKHVLLGYEMTSEDELKLKAFMFGNGDYSLTCIGFLALGLMLPELWPELLRHFRKGRRTTSIVGWSLHDYATANVETLRRQIGLYSA
jgi:ubiquinone biosynthesis protein Coq4